jgi:hypothetical protein
MLIRVFGCRPALLTTYLADVQTQRVGFVRNPAVCQVPGEVVAQASIRCRCPSVAPPIFGSAVPDSDADADADSDSSKLRASRTPSPWVHDPLPYYVLQPDAASRLAQHLN